MASPQRARHFTYIKADDTFVGFFTVQGKGKCNLLFNGFNFWIMYVRVAIGKMVYCGETVIYTKN